ncbi:MAG: sulfatase [Leptolyngbyaceae cyanobacterium SM2_5_2]|nr:sulfatase [Leptolyngbyaceae cyanobacterium SM2_5_2]
MRGSAMGFLQEEPVLTPNLDRFASQGLVLEQACATYPTCSPYRGILMTGKYPFSNRVIANCKSSSTVYGVELQEHDRCWSDVLHDNGYSLGYIGKWHLDAPREPYIDCANNKGAQKWNEWCPPHRRHGFDFWYSYGTYDDHTRPMYWSTHAGRDEFHFVDQWEPEHDADQAIAYIRNEGGVYRDHNRPFALVVSMNPPHSPYDRVPSRYVEPYMTLNLEEFCARPNVPPAGTKWGDYYRTWIRNYLAMITGVDEQFGRILNALDDAELADNTIVLFTSDHGNCLGIHSKGSKNTYYEEAVRVPFIIRWPGQIPQRHDDLLFAAPDIYPTLLDLMGFGADIPNAVEGTSYARLFQGESQARPVSQLCMRVSAPDLGTGWRAVRTHTHTLVVIRESSTEKRKPSPTRRAATWPNMGFDWIKRALPDTSPKATEQVRLYDNKKDPYQLKECASGHPAVVAQLTEELHRWLSQTKDPWLKP